uniref:Uncharacterized protein n=1 Tax=Arundo donax TaxID=35708 RepID=A0A0A8YD24_ARUDO
MHYSSIFENKQEALSEMYRLKLDIVRAHSCQYNYNTKARSYY